MFAPSILASCGRSRSMICDDGELALVARLEHDEAAPGVGGLRAAGAAGERCPDPRRPDRAGSPRPSSCISRIISSGEVSWAASAKAWIIPVSWIGKKPFGIWMAMTTVSAMVAKNTPIVIALVAQHDVERAPVERQHGARSPARRSDRAGRARRDCPLHEARAHHRRERQRHQRRTRRSTRSPSARIRGTGGR